MLEIFRLICQRRAVKFVRAESVALNFRLDFGMADATALLPAAANTFYFLPSLNLQTGVAQVTAPALLQVTKFGGSVGDLFIISKMAIDSIFQLFDLETDTLLYRVNGNTAGSISLTGRALKITYA